MNISECVAVVTGGASGLGEATVRRLVEGGVRAAVFDLDASRGTRLAGALGERVRFFETDVSDAQSVEAAVAQAVDAFGAIHVAVNCAGIGVPEKVLGKEGPMGMELFNRTLRINVGGTINVIRLTAARMAGNAPNTDGERGVIINTASIAAFEGQIGQAAYSASKAAIVGMTLPIAREFAVHGIRVVTIAPGLFDTPMMAGLPEKARQSLEKSIPFPPRLGRPAEFAALVEHIIANPVLNGETIRLDSAIRLAPL